MGRQLVALIAFAGIFLLGCAGTSDKSSSGSSRTAISAYSVGSATATP